MRFSYFPSVKAQRGELCTYEKFLEVSHSPMVAEMCAAIAREPDHEKQQQLKKQLPGFTFNAHFPGPRKNDQAEPSGLYMVDLDGVDNPFQFYSERICGRKEELGIVYVGLTPSRHGIRIVGNCQPQFSTIAECQQWMSEQIGCKCDPACKDFARFSYAVPFDYIYFLDAKGMFGDEPEVVYDVKVQEVQVVQEVRGVQGVEQETTPAANSFKGIPLTTIAVGW